MANEFFRKAAIGGDLNTWAPFNDAFNNDAIGKYSAYLYDDAGVLKVAIGTIGIDNGVTLGISDINVITTVNMAGVANDNWAKIEMTVAGTAVTFTATTIAGKTDPAVLPTEFTGAYDGTKRGYYIAADRRCIGVAFKDSGGVLAGVINGKNGIVGYGGMVYINTAQTQKLTWNVIQGVFSCNGEYQIGDWNMNVSVAGTASVLITHNLPEEQKVRNLLASIRHDGGTQVFQFAGEIVFMQMSNTIFNLQIEVGGTFDSTGFASTSFNRGWVTFDLVE